MDTLLVHGGTPLTGSINISGSKNASLPILAARVRRCTVRIKCANIVPDAPYELVRRMRASICVMGPLLSRLHRATVSLPGGCVIGDRPVDLHIKGLAALGADCDVEGGNMDLKAPKGGLVGTTLDLRGKHGPTVLGTDNIMMAACLAKGTTVIESAACEPEVVDLANFLNSMGAKITGAGTRQITIEGVEKLHGTEHTVIADRVEAGTFMAGAAAFSEGVTLNRVVEADLLPATQVLRECGHKVEFTKNGTSVTVTPGENPIGAQITTTPHPGFPTDMQAQFTALFATTQGISVIEDTIFPQRFMHCAELSRMGAKISVDQGRAIVTGVDQLSGAPVMASDLRASAALVLAALSAKGTTSISRLYHIDRGYEHIDEKLLQLGANVERVREK